MFIKKNKLRTKFVCKFDQIQNKCKIHRKMKIVLLILLSLLPCMAWTQVKNVSTEVKDYREIDGKIILDMAVNGEIASFVLDLAGHTAILSEYLDSLNIDSNSQVPSRNKTFLYKQVPVSTSVMINTMAFGNSVFGNGVSAYVLEDIPYFRKLGVVGVVGGSLFQNVVLTIDSRRKKITTSKPYRPSYMKLDHRAEIEIIPGSGIICSLMLDRKTYPLLFDTWNNGMISMTSEDFAKLNGDHGGDAIIMTGYKEAEKTSVTKTVGTCNFVKDQLGSVVVSENKNLPRSVLGAEILKRGIISIDYQKQKIYFQPFDLVEVKDDVVEDISTQIVPGKLNPITREYFLEHIYDYRKDKEFVFKGDKPVVIDFWATWCGPCMRLIPELEKMAEKYKDQVLFLKVNADKEKELCTMFNVVALPTLFFIPVGGKPIIDVGAQPEKHEQIIKEQLLKK